MNLEKLQLKELSTTEMKEITGGSFFGRAWKWIKEHVGIFDYGETIETSGSAIGIKVGVDI
ncbi:bacteriocin [Elizabethkingia occulta]|uniref:Bacteriocin n=1 Tax=Elizabethkingia occulta TaxID=1867263 RepID=A0A1T3M9Y3_9FLAO|nr:bacteriocin [Elizabethkingia occulta]OPB89386.1 hypothetical protein BB020_12510 [Elizabethkingia occulta]OPC61091.1 hypothetical protein BAZ10_11520 [Elizabethkingia occulta]